MPGGRGGLCAFGKNMIWPFVNAHDVNHLKNGIELHLNMHIGHVVVSLSLSSLMNFGLWDFEARYLHPSYGFTQCEELLMYSR